MKSVQKSTVACVCSIPLVLILFASAVFGEDGVKKVTQQEAIKAVVSKVQPAYPPMAKQLKVEGSVELEALVGEDGTVEKVNVIKGNPMLTKPGSDALKRWKFLPFTEAGKPVKALAPVAMHFSLDSGR